MQMRFARPNWISCLLKYSSCTLTHNTTHLRSRRMVAPTVSIIRPLRSVTQCQTLPTVIHALQSPIIDTVSNSTSCYPCLAVATLWHSVKLYQLLSMSCSRRSVTQCQTLPAVIHVLQSPISDTVSYSNSCYSCLAVAALWHSVILYQLLSISCSCRSVTHAVLITHAIQSPTSETSYWTHYPHFTVTKQRRVLCLLSMQSPISDTYCPQYPLSAVADQWHILYP